MSCIQNTNSHIWETYLRHFLFNHFYNDYSITEALVVDQHCVLLSTSIHWAKVSVPSGDVLLSINGVDLTQLTYNEAVSALKAQTAQSQVVLRVIQTLFEETEEDTEAVSRDELDPLDDPRDSTLNWTPLWTRWLGLPR